MTKSPTKSPTKSRAERIIDFINEQGGESVEAGESQKEWGDTLRTVMEDINIILETLDEDE